MLCIWMLVAGVLYPHLEYAETLDIYVGSDLLYWSEAREVCRGRGMELVKMNTPHKQQQVKSYLNAFFPNSAQEIDVWIGLKAIRHPPIEADNWRWADGTMGKESMDDWMEKQPNGINDEDPQGNEYCVFIRSSSNWQWLDTICDIKKIKYICEKPDLSELPPPDLYLELNNYKSWMDADEYCKQRGSELVKIDSAEKQERIVTFLETFYAREKAPVWLGLRATTLSVTNSSNFKWNDGSGVTYMNWYGSDPAMPYGENKDGNVCVNMYTVHRYYHMKWRTQWCTYEQSFICEKPVVDPPVITEMSPQKLVYHEDEDIELPCVASGKPQPSYYWKVNNEVFDPNNHGGRIDFKSGVGTLIFTKAEKEDEGIYQCFVENLGGLATSIQTDLRVGILEPFVSKEVVNHSPELGSGLTLRCDAPKSYPEPEYNWVTIEEYVAIIPIEISERVSIDPEGGLHLAHVIREDKQDGRQYACIVNNAFTGTHQLGNFQTVNPQGDNLSLSPPSIAWHSPSEQYAMVGETWKVMCILFGNPTPNIRWRRKGTSMPERSMTENFGRELVIDNVQFEDAGRYVCQGDNNGGATVKKTFVLTIGERPSWVIIPQNVEAPEGAKVEFECAASGLPQPSIVWHINNIPVSEMPPDPRRILSNNKLTLMNVTDDQVIQCNASNRHGYVFKNAGLNVNSKPADIRLPPKVNLEVNLGDTVELRCAVTGVPEPVVQWKKADEITTGSRFKVMDSGNLKISNVSFLDTGVYECIAANTGGLDSAKGSIVVRDESGIY